MAFLESEAAKAALKMAGPLVGAALLISAGVAGGIAYEHKAPWALGHQLARSEAKAADLSSKLDAANELAGAWAKSFHDAEGLRAGEHAQAVASLNAASAACSARVTEAKRSALAITNLVTKEVPHDAHGCPVRSLLDAGELRNALGSAPQGAPAR